MSSAMPPARARLSLFVAAAVAACGLVAAAAPAQAVSTPAGLRLAASPAGATILSWNVVAGATGYEVQVSTTAGFTAIVYDQQTSNHQATPTSALPMHDLWWRVRARSGSATGAWRAAATPIHRSQIAGPALTSPQDGAALAQPADPALLVWAPVAGATSYTVEVDSSADPDWVDSTSYTTQNTSFVVSSQQAPGTYSWRVSADIGSGQSTLPSPSRSYTILPLAAMTGVTPADGQVVDEVDFSWDAVPGAKQYDIQVSTDNSFNTIVDSKTVVGTHYSPASEYDVDQYWWRVRPKDAYGASPDWTDPSIPIRTFQRTWSDSVPTDPSTPESYQAQSDVPTLLHPADAVSPTVSTPLYYQWSPAHLASRYRIDVGSDPNFSPNSFSSCYATQTTYTPGFKQSPNSDGCWPKAGVTYWRVKALDTSPNGDEVQGVYSEIHRFVYTPTDITELTPADGAVDVDVPTVTWAAAPSVEQYKVTMTWPGGSRSTQTYATSYTPDSQLPAGTLVSWYVQSIDHNGVTSPAPLTGIHTFTYRGDPVSRDPSTAPLTPTPVTTPVDRAPALSWAPYDGASSYQVYVAPAGTGLFTALSKKAVYPAQTDTTSSLMATGSYDWFVRALDSKGATLADGTWGSFTVADLAPVTGQEVVLNGDALDSGCTRSIAPDESTTDMNQVCQEMTATPVLHWAPVAGAAYYLVYLANDDHFQNMVYGSLSNSTSLPSTVNTVWTPTAALPDSNAGHPYYWFIRPCKATNICAPDPVRPTNAFGKNSPAVTGLAVADDSDGASLHENDITFSWDDYLATNRSTLNTETGEHPGQAARQYHLQISTSASFSTMVDDVKVDETTYTSSSKLYPEGSLFWRVQAMDGSGNGLTWTDAQPFTKSSPTVTGLSPTSPQTSVKPLRWTPTTFAATYDLEVYKNGDEAASTSNRVVSVSGLRQTAYSPTTPLPSGMDYAWRVRRADASSGKGAWSAWAHFRVTAPAPAQVTPQANALVPATGALFQWTPPSGDGGKYAAYYLFERRATGSTSTAESVTTAQPAWAPTSTISTGSWQWRVTALDVAKRPMGSTPWRTFRVDATAPTIKSHAPTVWIKKTANISVTFSEKVVGISARTVRVTLGSATVKVKLTLNAAGTKLTINPNATLKVGKVYKVALTNGITDTAKNRLTATHWSLTATR